MQEAQVALQVESKKQKLQEMLTDGEYRETMGE
jgi:hypothetical protein